MPKSSVNVKKKNKTKKKHAGTFLMPSPNDDSIVFCGDQVAALYASAIHRGGAILIKGKNWHLILAGQLLDPIADVIY